MASQQQQPALLPPNYQIKPRASTETDRRHLLSDSVSPSESASMIFYDETDGERTPRAGSPHRSVLQHASSDAHVPERRGTIATSAPAAPYRGFPSEAHYLAALREWAEERQTYADYHSQSLVGFYGVKSMEQYASQPGLELGIAKKWRARKQRKQEARRGTVA